MTESSLFYLAASSGALVNVWSLSPVDLESRNSSTGSPPVFKPIQTFETASSPACDMTWHPRRCKLATLHSSFKSHITLYSLPGGEKELHHLPTDETQQHLFRKDYSTHTTCFAFPRQAGRFLAVGHTDGRVTVYDLRKELSPRTRIDLSAASSSCPIPSCVAWAARDRLLIIGTSTSSDLYVCLAAHTDHTHPGFAQLPYLPSVAGSLQNTSCLTLRTCRLDSTLVAAGYSSGEVIVWQLDWPLSRHPNDHIFFRCNPRHVSASFQELLSVTWSPTDTYTLFTSGAPDLSLRLWSVNPSSVSSTPLKELTMPDMSRGYLTNDVSLDGLILSTGLMNGRVWIYDTRNISTPLCELAGCDSNPVQFLMFAFTSQPLDEVRFVPGLEHNMPVGSRMLEQEGTNKYNPVASHSMDLREPLRNLSNLDDTSGLKSIDGWSDVYRSISLPESPELSDSESRRPSLSGNPFPLPNGLELASFGEPLTAPSTGLFGSQPPRTPNPPLQTMPPCSTGGATNIVGSLTKKHLDDFRADIQLSHVNMLYHFSRLEEKVENMFERFSEALVELKKENDALRVQLDKRWYFH